VRENCIEMLEEAQALQALQESKKRLAVASALHSRLGENTPLNELDIDTFHRMIGSGKRKAKKTKSKPKNKNKINDNINGSK
jgi:hypothetical protein